MSNVPFSIPVSETGSSLTVTSVKQFDNQLAFEAHVLSTLSQVKEYHEFVFTNVPASWGKAVFQLIDEEISSR